MMKETENFEHWIRSKLAEKPFPYDEAYWGKAEAQFATWDRQKKKRRFFFWIFAVGLLSTGIGAWSVLSYSDMPSEALIAANLQDSCANDLGNLNDLASLEDIPDLSAHSSISTHPPSNASTYSLDHSLTHNGNLEISSQDKANSAISQTPSDHTISSLLTSSMQETKNKTENIAFDETPPSDTDHLQINLQTIDQSFPFLWSLTSHLPQRVEVIAANRRRIRPYVKLDLTLSPYQLAHLRSTSFSSFQPKLELGLSFPVQSRLSIHSGLSYYRLTIDETSANLSYIEYDFIFRSEEIQWTPERLHYVGWGIGLDMRLLPRHSIGGELNIAHLLTTKGQLIEGYRSSFESTSGDPETVFHYRNGLPDWDGQARIVYTYQMSRKWSMQVAGQYGFRNLTKDDVFTQQNPNRYSGLTVSLQYWFR